MDRKPLILIGALTVVVLFVVGLVAATGGDGDDTAAPPTSSTQPPTTPTTADTETPTELLPPQAIPSHLAHLESVWETDWSKATVDLDEIIPGLRASDPRDLIAPLDDPKRESITEADEWLEDREPGVLLNEFGVTRFYPLRILTAHEVVNDEAGGVPIAVTFCPLCNSAVGFVREIDGETARLGVSGLLRSSDLIMWDDLTESLWQQITGEAIVGELAGHRLEFIAVSIVSWGDFKESFPQGDVLSRDTGFGFGYGSNAYTFYSTRPAPSGLFTGELDPRLPAMERVVGVRIDEATKAYPFSVIGEERVVNDEVNGVPIVVVWGSEDTADALDAPIIAEGQAIGTGVAYDRRVDGQVLTFEPIDDSTFRDVETGSTWTILGVATAGPLAGSQLESVIHLNEFWFAWAAFNPEAPVYSL